MQVTKLLKLYSNIHKKPRRLNGTYMFVFRYYIWGGLLGFGGLTAVAFYFSPLQDIVIEKSYVAPENFSAKGTLNSAILFPKPSKELLKELLRAKKDDDFHS